MRLMSLSDQLFMLLETRQQPMHVGGLFLFELPEDADDDFVLKLASQMQTSTTPPTFPLNQVLHNLTKWKTDEDFEVEHHFRHIALPKPARVRELLSYISKEHSRLLDRARPLWECHLIEGIEPEVSGRPKRFGMYFKIHHSLVDGVAAMRLVRKSLLESPDEPLTLPFWSYILRHRHQVETLMPKQRKIGNIIKEQLSTVGPVLSEMIHNVLPNDNSDYINTLQAPPSVLNQKISSSRRFIADSYDISRFKHTAKVLNVSINDILLEVCAGALREYLLSINELPNKPLIAWVPYSMRSDETVSGNQFAFILCNLGTHLADPIERLKLVHNSMNDGKTRFNRMTQAQVVNYSLLIYSWEFANIITNINPKKQAFNLIISNVTGSKKPLYCNGAKMTALYPASIVFNGQAMNITVTSYLDRINFGVTACSKTLPHIQVILKYFEKELSDLEAIANEREMGVRL